MTAQGIQQGEVSKRFQSLNEISIPGHRKNTGNPGTALFAEFQNVLDKIAVALDASGGEQAILDGMLQTEVAPTTARAKEKGEQQKEQPASEESNEPETEVVTKATGAEGDVRQAAAEPGADNEESIEAEEVTDEEEAEVADEARSEEVSEELEAIEGAAVIAEVTETQMVAGMDTTTATTTKVELPAQEEVSKETDGIEELITDVLEGKGKQSSDQELVNATRQLTEAKQELASQRKGTQEFLEGTQGPAENSEQVDMIVKQFMESLRNRLQSNSADEQPAYGKATDGHAHAENPQQNAAAVLSQLILRNATQNTGEAGKGLNNAVQNVMAAVTKSDAAKRGDAGSEAMKDAQRLPKNFESRTLAKVEEALKEVARSKDGKTISVRLDPPSLGKVKVDVSVREGVLHARLQADSAQVTTLLREHGLDLQYALRKLGLNVDEVSVTVTPDQGDRDTAFENFTEHGGSNGNTEDLQEEQSATNGISNDGAREPSQTNNETDDHWVA